MKPSSICCLPQASLAGDVPPRTIVLRSFGKTYGLAGLRLGFAIAGPSLIDRIRDELGPWAVSGPALEIGRTALCDDRWLAATTARLAADQQRLDGILAAAGFQDRRRNILVSSCSSSRGAGDDRETGAAWNSCPRFQ